MGGKRICFTEPHSLKSERSPAQLIRSQERNRQENANANTELCSNESNTFEVQEGCQQVRVVVVDKICINEFENNANYTFSAEHTTNTPTQFQWGELSGEVLFKL